jgi:hypothetical protein
MSNDWSGTGASDSYSLRTYYGHLFVSQIQGYEDFTDIIKDVVIFASEGIEIYDTLSDQETADISGDVTDFNYVASNSIGSDVSEYKEYNDFANGIHVLKYRDKMDIINELKSTSRFYKICSLGLAPVENIDLATKIETHTLENIVNQTRIEDDDYFSRSTLYPSFLYSYNSRLNIANVSRGFFEGYGNFMPFDDAVNIYNYTFYVRIKLDDGRAIWISHSEETKQKQGCYFFYPDSRADHVVIYKGSTCVLDQNLEEHSRLNGSFYLAGLPGIDYTDETSVAPSVDPRNLVNNDTKERLANYIIQSVVNNPWMFQADGYFKVGTGKIVGITSITQALSQGQFGQSPLLVFSESGIWALSVGSEGYYTAIHPMSRDVCINPGSILQTDGAVFFVSKKGLMVVAGKEVVCVSERMNGATFNTAQLSPLAADTDWEDIVEACQDSNSFLDYIRDEGMFMAYDYIDSRIVMVNPRFGYSFIYNIADATISKVILPAAMTNAVNNYPDYLIQGLTDDSHQRVYSFYGKKREDEVTGRQLGFLLTRPMKLSGPIAKASLRQLMHVGIWNKGTASNPLSCVKTEIWLSDDLQKWYSDISRFGTAAKYYRLALYIKMLPTERLSGTILTEQPRRTKNLK